MTDERPQAVFDVAAYLVASARDCLDGPIAYASLRMLETTRRLIDATERTAGVEDAFLHALRERLEEGATHAMSDRDAYVRWLDSVLVDLADEARRRNVAAS